DYGKNKVLIVVPAHGFIVCGGKGVGCHGSSSNSAFWATVPADAGVTGATCSTSNCALQLVTAHEIFEAATHPGYNNKQGWIGKRVKEAVDGCNSSSEYPFITLAFGQIPGAADNTQGGKCSNSGYSRISGCQIGGGGGGGTGGAGGGGECEQGTPGCTGNIRRGGGA